MKIRCEIPEIPLVHGYNCHTSQFLELYIHLAINYQLVI